MGPLKPFGRAVRVGILGFGFSCLVVVYWWVPCLMHLLLAAGAADLILEELVSWVVYGPRARALLKELEALKAPAAERRESTGHREISQSLEMGKIL